MARQEFMIDFGPSIGPISSFILMSKIQCEITAVSGTFVSGTFKAQAKSALQFSAAVPADPGASFIMHITLPPFDGIKVLELWQSFRVGPGFSLIPLVGNDDRSETSYKLHPRVTLQVRPGKLPNVRVDIMFIDVTHVLKKGHKRQDYALADYEHLESPIDFQSGEPSARIRGSTNPDPAEFHHGCQLHIFEMTLGRPKAWAVIVPEALRTKREKCNLLAFFQPTLGPKPIGKYLIDYTDTLDCRGYFAPHLPRYSRDPQAEGPSYFQTTPAVTDALTHFFLSGKALNNPNDDERISMRHRFWRKPYPYTGFEGQIQASRRPVALVMPFSHGANMDYGAAITDRFRQIMISLVRALAGDGSIGEAGMEMVKLDRVAVGGFSSGGGAALGAWGANKDLVSELYLFDCFSGLKADTFVGWLKNPDRRLCLIGGSGLELGIRIHKDLLKALPAASHGNVVITPSNLDFFNSPGNNWEAALFPPANAGWEGGVRRLDNASEPSPGPYSKSTHVYVKTEKPKIILQARPAGTSKSFEQAVNVTRVETAGLVRMWQIARAKVDGVPGPPFGYRAVESESDLKELTRSTKIGEFDIGTGTIDDMRHQWAVGGGIGNVARYPYGEQNPVTPDGKTFEGHLHFCLKGSRFR